MRSAWNVLVQPIGLWRTQLFWRLFGLTIVNSPLLDGVYRSREIALGQPLSFHVLMGSALVLMLGGSRLVSLLVTAIAACWALGPICFGAHGSDNYYQVADEFIIFMALPVMGVLVSAAVLLTSSDRRSEVQAESAAQFARLFDASHVVMVRITLLVTMAFAFLHKLNVDFLDSKTSCGRSLAATLARDWQIPFPEFLIRPSPELVLLGEGSLPLLLLLYPRLGILATICVIGVIGHVGAVAFTVCVVSMSLMFWNDDDKKALLSGLRTYLLVLVPCFLVFLRLSFPIYVGTRPWTGFVALQLVSASGLFFTLWIISASPRNARTRGFGFLQSLAAPEDPRAALSTGSGIVAALLVAYTTASVANGLSPYLGLKYRLSAAMLSNLRADDNRWNSLVFPQWMYARSSDPFVHVNAVEIPYDQKKRIRAFVGPGQWLDYRLVGGLYAPWSFKKRVQLHRDQKIAVRMSLTYRNQTRVFDDLNSDEFQSWFQTLPGSRLFQAHLTNRGAQRCIH
jgi:hypothetical protein